MVGTSLATKGGISSVIRSYMETDFFQKWRVIYISTHIDGGGLRKLFFAVRALGLFVFYLMVKKVQLVHVHSASNASFYRKSFFILFAHLAGVKVIFHLHGGGFIKFYRNNETYVSGRYIKSVLLSVEKIIVLSEQWKSALEEIIGVQNVAVIQNPIPSEKWLDLKRCTNGKIIIFLGLLTKDKGIYDLLRAVSIVKKKIPEICVKIGGVGEVDKVVSFSKDMGLGDSVELLGWVDGREKEGLFASASLFVLPSYYEGVPISILESMAVGVPVIATNVGGIPSIIKNGVNGVLVNPGDVESLSNAIVSLLTNSQIRESLSDNAKKDIINDYLPSKVIESIDLLYSELLN